MRALVRQYPGNPEPTLKGLSFDLPAGTLTALLGRSGAGKSTLLRCVLGLEPFEQGSILVDGVEVPGTAASTPAARELALRQARAKLGLVFQSYELFPHLSVLDNCTLAPMKVQGLGRAKAEEKARALLVQLGLEHRIAAWPEQLSGGQKQRVAIARALAMEPRVLLYDEPTSALDPSLKAEVLQTLKRVDATGVTQVVVTHDLQLARGVEHVCVLDHGQVIESGPPGEVLVAPKHESTRTLLKSWLDEG
ncbi:MAG: amino acid ABC transporter ATP-binding protein [Myxococcaceae bacterium]|nr:amino acid ABC transporter ATP-binding protein [Myxococcaceae bacterium]